jgi:hypothetical protein
MAVYQISRIQHRRGTASELPDALADGEIGMTTDTGEVFYGAPNHPAVSGRRSYPYQNIKIITELDVQRGIKGDVYHHGALAAASLPSNVSSVFVSCIPLFAHGSREFAVYDFGLSANNGNLKILGEISICVHPSDPDLSQIGVVFKSTLGQPDTSAIEFRLTRLSSEGTDNGISWLSCKTGISANFTLTMNGREWSTPVV